MKDGFLCQSKGSTLDRFGIYLAYFGTMILKLDDLDVNIIQLYSIDLEACQRIPFLSSVAHILDDWTKPWRFFSAFAYFFIGDTSGAGGPGEGCL